MSEMGRCRDCYWWEPYTLPEADGLGTCELPNQVLRIISIDDCGCRASLQTPQDFGCIQFKVEA